MLGAASVLRRVLGAASDLRHAVCNVLDVRELDDVVGKVNAGCSLCVLVLLAHWCTLNDYDAHIGV